MSELTHQSKVFYSTMSSRKLYYEALMINISMSGNYTFTSVSSVDMYGYLYYNEFDPLMPCQNLLQENDDIADDVLQFQIQSTLQSFITYILVVTTYHSNRTGKFSIISQGPKKVQIMRMNSVLVSGEFANHFCSAKCNDRFLFFDRSHCTDPS